MEKKRIEILGVGFDPVDGAEAAERICAAALRERSGEEPPFFVVTPNPLMVMNARRDGGFADILAGADLSLADGVGVVSAARRAGTPLPERVTGLGTATAVVALLAERGGSVFYLGARPGRAQKAAQNHRDAFGDGSGLRCAGCADGYFTDAEEPELLERIRQARPDLLAVCLGSPKQEKWIAAHRDELRGVGAVMALGGVIDVWAGQARAAPVWVMRLGLEWLWRMLREPRRLRGLPDMIRFRLLTRRRF